MEKVDLECLGTKNLVKSGLVIEKLKCMLYFGPQINDLSGNLKRKVGLCEDTVPDNTWQGNPRDSATENKPYQARVKRCGRHTGNW